VTLFLLNSPLDVPQRECGANAKTGVDETFTVGTAQPSPPRDGTHTRKTLQSRGVQLRALIGGPRVSRWFTPCRRTVRGAGCISLAANVPSHMMCEFPSKLFVNALTADVPVTQSETEQMARNECAAKTLISPVSTSCPRHTVDNDMVVPRHSWVQVQSARPPSPSSTSLQVHLIPGRARLQVASDGPWFIHALSSPYFSLSLLPVLFLASASTALSAKQVTTLDQMDLSLTKPAEICLRSIKCDSCCSVISSM
jgi:hypothetical protein